MEIYNVEFNKDEDILDFISIVNDPAIEENFIKMSSESIKVNYDNDKKIITGPVLIPDKAIERIDEKSKKIYYIKFSKETIYDMNFSTMKNLYNKVNMFNLEHNDVVEKKNYVILENWIKESENDKSNDNFKLPIGTWFITVKIEDDKLWEDIKLNKNGFSIEGMLKLKKINFSSNNNNDLRSFLRFLK